jgi:3-oxoacyl-[acyl-carrier protein] reductase
VAANKDEFAGKTVLITGASSGVGEALSKSFAQATANLVLISRNPRKLQNLRTQLCLMNREIEVKVFSVDLGDAQTFADMIAALESECQDVDVIINNAGYYPPDGFAELTQERIAQQITLHVSAAVRLIQLGLGAMRKRRFGRIVNIASAAAFLGSRSPGYAISKNAMVGLTRSLAREVARFGITVNAIVPGPIITPMTKNLSLNRRREYVKRIPAGRFGTVDEVAQPVLFLCSSGASYINGQCIHVNGGLVMPD